MNDLYTNINGEWFQKEEAAIKVSDLSIQRGYGIFDYLKTLSGRPVFLEDHLDRFYFSASEMNLKPDLRRDQLKKLIQQLIEKNRLEYSGIRITLTGGYSANGYSVSKPNLIITQEPLQMTPDAFNNGIKLITNEHQRQLPHIKTIDYIYAIYVRNSILEHGGDEVLYHNQGEVTECPRANFFIVTNNNDVITPSKNVLRGITRKKILQFSQLVSIREGLITLRDLENAREAFITSTTKNVLPVVSINGRTIGTGKPGEITEKISRKLMTFMRNGK